MSVQKITTLRDETRNLLLNRPSTLDFESIARQLGVSKSWLQKFANNEIKNPGVVTIQTLNQFLKTQIKRLTNA